MATDVDFVRRCAAGGRGAAALRRAARNHRRADHRRGRAGARARPRRRSRAGAHAAGYLAYEAGHALDPKLAASARQGDGPLLSFGLFDGFTTPDLGELLPSPDGAFVGPPRPRITPRRL